MKKTKYLLFSAVLLASMQSVAQNPINDNPAYSIVGKDSTCQVFIYSPAENQGLHLAYFTDDERWVDVGQLCASDFGPWGSEKKMYRPFVMKANDGTWRALWSVNSRSPQFAVAYSEDLVTWRPQDYPIMKEKGITDVAAYQMDDGTFDIYLKTAKGKRYVHADRNFRTLRRIRSKLLQMIFSGSGILQPSMENDMKATTLRFRLFILIISVPGIRLSLKRIGRTAGSCPTMRLSFRHI